MVHGIVIAVSFILCFLPRDYICCYCLSLSKCYFPLRLSTFERLNEASILSADLLRSQLMWGWGEEGV